MTTLQEYLDNKYPTKKDKKELKQFCLDRWELSGDFPHRIEGGKLNLKGYTNLEFLRIDGNRYCLRTPLTEIDVAGCTNLQTLVCRYSELTHLNVSSCHKLKVLDCKSNQLKELNLKYNFNLEELECSRNQLTSHDFLKQLSNLNKLEKLLI